MQRLEVFFLKEILSHNYGYPGHNFGLAVISFFLERLGDPKQ